MIPRLWDKTNPIYIHDLETETYTNLQEQTYEIILPAGNYTDHFEITFQEASEA
jgi:hypothetical protein